MVSVDIDNDNRSDIIIIDILMQKINILFRNDNETFTTESISYSPLELLLSLSTSLLWRINHLESLPI